MDRLHATAGLEISSEKKSRGKYFFIPEDAFKIYRLSMQLDFGRILIGITRPVKDLYNRQKSSKLARSHCRHLIVFVWQTKFVKGFVLREIWKERKSGGKIAAVRWYERI